MWQRRGGILPTEGQIKDIAAGLMGFESADAAFAQKQADFCKLFKEVWAERSDWLECVQGSGWSGSDGMSKSAWRGECTTSSPS